MTTATQNGDLGQETAAYESLGNTYQLLGDYRKAIEYHKKHLKIAIETGDRDGEGEAYGISVMLTSHCVTIEKLLSITKNI